MTPLLFPVSIEAIIAGEIEELALSGPEAPIEEEAEVEEKKESP